MQSKQHVYTGKRPLVGRTAKTLDLSDTWYLLKREERQKNLYRPVYFIIILRGQTCPKENVRKRKGSLSLAAMSCPVPILRWHVPIFYYYYCKVVQSSKRYPLRRDFDLSRIELKANNRVELKGNKIVSAFGE